MAKKDFDLIAELREDQGKGASRRLRRQGKVPAIVYGAGRPPRMVTLDHNRVIQQLENESFYSSVLNVKVGDKEQAVILKDLQRHPAKRQILHMDLQRIREDEAIRMNVPIHFLNEDIAVGVKQGGGSVSRLMTDVEVVCLPKDLPEYLEVDIAELELDELRYISDIPLPEGVEAQTRRVMDNLILVLEGLSLGLEHVLQARAYLTHFERDYPAMNATYASYFPENRRPARTCIGVTGLARGALVEIDMVARRPD